MKIFLLAVAGALVGLILLVAIGWLWLKRRLRGLGKALGALAAGLSGVPPFRVTLVPTVAGGFEDAAAVDTASESLEAVGYQRLDDFEIGEMEDVLLRGFWHPEQHFYGAVYEHPQVGVFADVVGLFRDRTISSVSSGPETGLDRPERMPLVRLQLAGPEDTRQLHERLLHEAGGRASVATRPEEFAPAFEGAYRTEQNWRIARGGVTQEEVRRAAAAGGQAAPDDCAVQLVCSTWRAAIGDFVGEQVLAAWLASQPMDAAAWEARRERIRVVHDHLDPETLVDELAWAMIAGRYDPEDDEAENRAHEAAKGSLEAGFSAGVRAGFAGAQAQLPEKQRFEKLGEVTRPWGGDLYAEPEGPDAV